MFNVVHVRVNKAKLRPADCGSTITVVISTMGGICEL